MMSMAVKLMLYGVIVAEEIALVAIFLRFRRRSGERLFAFFAAGFAVMAVHRVLLGFTMVRSVNLEQQTPVFLVRLLSYVLILAGIVIKNIEQRAPRRPSIGPI